QPPACKGRTRSQWTGRRRHAPTGTALPTSYRRRRQAPARSLPARFAASWPRCQHPRPSECSCRGNCASISNNRRSVTMRTPKGRFEDLANLQTGESGRAMRMFLLTYEYGSTIVPLARCAELFGYSPDEAAKRAARAGLPVPAFGCGSEKSPLLSNVEDLADYLEGQRHRALQEWKKVNGISHALS